MKKTILMMMFMISCAVDMTGTANDAGTGTAVQASVLTPPRPHPQFSFCTTYASVPIQCDPNQANADNYCDEECNIFNGQGGYCEQYTDLEWRQCAATCDPVRCDSTFCFPDGEKRCIRGQRP